jgi:NADH-quinone oxidoreductase subunit N
VAFLRNEIRSEEIQDYAGLIRRSPGIVICFSVILASLLGLPPLNGFAAKLVALYSLIPAGLTWLLVVGLLNTFLSLFYYLRVIKVMALDPEPADRLPVRLTMVSGVGVYTALISVPVLIFGVWWDPAYRWAQDAAAHLLTL